jgi:hypothetical protein
MLRAVFNRQSESTFLCAVFFNQSTFLGETDPEGIQSRTELLLSQPYYKYYAIVLRYSDAYMVFH